MALGFGQECSRLRFAGLRGVRVINQGFGLGVVHSLGLVLGPTSLVPKPQKYVK